MRMSLYLNKLFISIKYIVESQGCVLNLLDPFAGSGTTILEKQRKEQTNDRNQRKLVDGKT